MDEQVLIAELAPVMRLALAYAPRRSRAGWLGILALDSRLCAIVRQAREPILAQIRLAWWRERLEEDPSRWPAGEPLLHLIGAAMPEPATLAPLVDGWEALLGDAPLGSEALANAAQGRAQGLSCLSREALPQARGWALADMAAHLSHPAERDAAQALMQQHDWQPRRLPRAMRPLVVLNALAARMAAGKPQDGAGALLAAMRAGLFGK